MFLICETDSDIFNTTCKAVVNPVNCNGVSGKGLALDFRQRYPENYEVYRIACKSNYLKIGVVLPYVTETGLVIYNFPTKNNWWQPAEFSYIQEGLDDLIFLLSYMNISSVAIPAIGCGLGSLSWDMVKQEIIRKFVNARSELPHFQRLELYRPL